MQEKLNSVKKNSETPLEKEIHIVVNRITIFAVIVGIIFFAASAAFGMNIILSFVYGIGIFISCIPEGTPLALM